MVRQLANTLITSLREAPLALALVVINIVFLIALALTLREIGDSIERKDNLLAELIRNCDVRH